MTLQQKLKRKFGNTTIPAKRREFERYWMTVWIAPAEALSKNPLFPKKIYMNTLLVPSWNKVVKKLIDRDLIQEITSYGGCFNPRYQRGSLTELSIHSWGLAIDFNVAENPLIAVTHLTRERLRKENVTWTEAFLNCFREEEWTCGADWITKLDGMHFEKYKEFVS